jgi:single-strand DNA-binding protein
MPATIAEFDITGYLGKDPEIGEWGSAKYTRLNIAVTDKWTTKAGEKQEETSWFSVTAWDKVGEKIAEYTAKGDKIRVRGRMKTKVIEGDDGSSRSVTNFRVNDFFLQGSRGANNNGNGNNNSSKRTDNNNYGDAPF